MTKDWTLFAEVYLKELNKVLLTETSNDEYVRTAGIIEGIEFCLINKKRLEE